MCKTGGKSIHEIENNEGTDSDEDDSEDESFKIDCVAKKDSRKSRKKRWYEKIEVNGKAVIEFKVDTGADVNTIPRYLYEQVKDQEKLLATSENLYNYDNGNVVSMGRCFLPCIIRNKKFVLEFYIIDSQVKPVIGWESGEDTGLVVRIDQLVKQEKQEKTWNLPDKFLPYKECFQPGVGQFKDEYKIILREKANPAFMPPGRCRWLSSRC